MADRPSHDDTIQKLNAMARQGGCLAEYLRRGDIELARWLLREWERDLRRLAHELDG